MILNRKIKAYYFGLLAELVSCFYLKFKFYSIISRRFKCPFGEIDIIAKKGKSIIFIEIKARSNLSCMELISNRQKHRIIKAAEFFLIKNRDYGNYQIRFDTIFLNKYFWPTHFKQYW